MRKRKEQIYFWAGLGVITVLYALYYLLFLYRAFIGMPLHTRHLIKFLWILLVMVVGNFCIKRFAAPWVLRIWRIVYLAGLGALILLGAFDWAVMRVPLPIREVADDLQELLVSPLVYVGIGILNRVVPSI